MPIPASDFARKPPHQLLGLEIRSKLWNCSAVFMAIAISISMVPYQPACRRKSHGRSGELIHQEHESLQAICSFIDLQQFLQANPFLRSFEYRPVIRRCEVLEQEAFDRALVVRAVGLAISVKENFLSNQAGVPQISFTRSIRSNSSPDTKSTSRGWFSLFLEVP